MKLIHYKILTVVLTILLIGTLVWTIQQTGLKSLNKISADQAASKVITYINNILLQNKATANLLSITEDNQKGLYKLEIQIGNQNLESYVSFDGKIFYPEVIDLEIPAATATSTSEKVSGGETVDGNFIKLADQEISKENGKPIIYFFGSATCPHCQWEKPILEKVVDSFGDKIVFHEDIDSFGADQNIFAKYSDGSVPTIVLAGRYYRIGSGEEIGEQKEAEVLTKLIQDLLN